MSLTSLASKPLIFLEKVLMVPSSIVVEVLARNLIDSDLFHNQRIVEGDNSGRNVCFFPNVVSRIGLPESPENSREQNTVRRSSFGVPVPVPGLRA